MIGSTNLDYTFHDIQFNLGETNLETTSDVFVDIPGAVIEASDLGEIGTYPGWFSFVIQGSSSNTTATFRVTINGVPPNPDGRAVLLKTNNQDFTDLIMGKMEGVVAGDVLQMQWKTDKGTLTLERFELMFDGVRTSRVVDPAISPGLDSYLLEDGTGSLLLEDGSSLLLE